MPCTEGSPMKIHTREGAIPKVVHKPVPVALHWRAKVKADLDADVKRGVLEKGPAGVPDTWCTQMVITPKNDGRPRRCVDLAALSNIDVFHGGAGGVAAPPSILAGYLLGQKMEDFHG